MYCLLKSIWMVPISLPPTQAPSLLWRHSPLRLSGLLIQTAEREEDWETLAWKQHTSPPLIFQKPKLSDSAITTCQRAWEILCVPGEEEADLANTLTTWEEG